MPDESAEHAATWMCFVASEKIWQSRQIPVVKRDLVSIAKAVAGYEPVNILVAPEDVRELENLLSGGASTRFPILCHEAKLNDLWVRDSGPVFLLNEEGKLAALGLNFNAWGGKQDHGYDSQVARRIANLAHAEYLQSACTLEGGCFEVDGHGTAIMSESCIINNNRNPGWTKDEIEAELSVCLGLKRIIWLQGVKGKDITDGHTDFYARFAGQGTVIVNRDNDESSFDYEITRKNISALKNKRDLAGRKLNLVILDTPWEIETKFGIDEFAAGYLGYYLCNGAVVMQAFGDAEADKIARQKIQDAFPERTIEQIEVNGIASGGGSIHCATQQQPAVTNLAKS